MRLARAHSCGCKSRRELITANEVKRNCMRGGECVKEAWSINREPVDKNRICSQPEGGRAMTLLRKMYGKLHLTVNEAKSAVASVFGRKFLGFSFWVAPKGEIKCKVAAKPLATYKQRIRQLTRRSGGRSMAEVVESLLSVIENAGNLANSE